MTKEIIIKKEASGYVVIEKQESERRHAVSDSNAMLVKVKELME